MQDYTNELKNYKGRYKTNLELVLYTIKDIEEEYLIELDLSWEEIVDILDYSIECCERYYPGSNLLDNISCKVREYIDFDIDTTIMLKDENGYFKLVLCSRDEMEQALHDIENNIDILYGWSEDITQEQYERYEELGFTCIELGC
jgi:hypothetical protein